jgi:GNAT superfamily N-acetyltransferase
MPRFPQVQSRPLDPVDAGAAIELARAAGAHGVYVWNALAQHEGETAALHGRAGLLGLCWFGARGNLILLEREPLEPRAVAAAVLRAGWPWRIALGPAPAVAALARAAVATPLVHRDQVYYGASPGTIGPVPDRGVRAPVAQDQERLMQATLELNQSDLNVDPRRVDRRWLADTVRGRIDDGSARVIGPVGQIRSKLDIGSDGPAGIVVEGVFTFASARGQGLASALVATVARAATAPFVCLHVGADNAPARAAYARAGLEECGRCRLLLLG